MREAPGILRDPLAAKRVRGAAWAGVLFYSAGLFLSLIHFSRYMPSGHLSVAARLLGLAFLAVVALRRRSLMAWIFWSMLAGAELGLDAPIVAVGLRVLSDIFLRLIKAIVAPLLLGTLITGIAPQGDARSLGRLGIKTLIYFEVLSAVALLIGLGAINLTGRG